MILLPRGGGGGAEKNLILCIISQEIQYICGIKIAWVGAIREKNVLKKKKKLLAGEMKTNGGILC